MSGKSIAVVLLAMCGSFTTILAVMGLAIAASDEPRRPRAAVRAPAPPTPPSTTDSRLTERRSRTLELLAAEEDGTPFSDLPSRSSTRPEVGSPAAGSAPVPEVERLSRESASRLAQVEATLARQVASLKNSRDQLLDEFAEDLAAMPVAEATRQMALLDDDTAGMALKRLGPARQKAILRSLPESRRAALQKLLSLASR